VSAFRTKPPSRADLHREQINAVATLLTQVRSALFITGPALSGDSGLPHFRGITGLLRKNPADSKIIEQALSIETLNAQPKATWKYLFDMDDQIRAVAPNRGHQVLAEAEFLLQRATVMTINVDRLHQRAGSKNVIEMHGALHDLLCPRCEISTRHKHFANLPNPPTCHVCGTVLRPDMPLFGEALPPDPFTRLQAEIDQGFDIVFAIGVGTMFPYLARPILLARAEGTPTVEIGPTHTDVTDVVDFRFRGSPMRVLDLIWDARTTLLAGS
jgi:NAD-dependent deacetylase